MAVDVASQTKADHLYRIRHSAAHVLAEAVLQVFPEAKLAIGPPVDDGFYYDFLLPRPISSDDLADLEERMKAIVKGDHHFSQTFMEKDEAIEYFKARGQDFKVEIITDLPEEGLDNGRVGIFTQSAFTDLCKGPHVETTKDIGAFKLTHVAGAYWRGDEKRPMLQRIYGTAWENQAELDDYLHRLEEAARRDHRKLGKELELFHVSEEVGPGLILWMPKGARIRSTIEDYLKALLDKNGYVPAYSPHITRGKLFETSGHLGFYKDTMFAPMVVDEQDFYVKPMTCPFHIQMYSSRLRSYRELPIRIAEFGTVYRYERSGVLHGLLRVRGFTQDDAHIFCMREQLDEEVWKATNLALQVLRDFGFTDFNLFLSTQPEKSVGSDADWRIAENSLRGTLDKLGLGYQVDEGGGAFYGPKIDIMIRDAIGRSWQCGTVQFDFNMNERFDMTYIGSDGAEHRPYMVHRALLGSFERFFGMLIEHYAGAFPVWLSPVQAQIIPITDRHHEYAQLVADELREAGIRVEIDGRSERMQAKIREAQMQKVPYMLVVGDKEADNRAVAVRVRGGDNLGAMPLDDFLVRVKDDIKERR